MDVRVFISTVKKNLKILKGVKSRAGQILMFGKSEREGLQDILLLCVFDKGKV